MERFNDYDIESTPDGYEVSAYDSLAECPLSEDISYWQLVSFVQKYYDFTKNEAVWHLAQCEEHETELLLTECFKNKMS